MSAKLTVPEAQIWEVETNLKMERSLSIERNVKTFLMKLKIIQKINQVKVLELLIYNEQKVLLSTSKKLENLIEQTQTKPQKTLEHKINSSSMRFTFGIFFKLEENWTLGSSNLEV